MQDHREEEGDGSNCPKTACRGLAVAGKGRDRQIRQPRPGSLLDVRLRPPGASQEPAEWDERLAVHTLPDGPTRHWAECAGRTVGHQELQAAAE